MARPAGRGGDVRVADAKGAPPTIPFWLGEAPARSDELSRAVSDLRAEVDAASSSPPALRRHRVGDGGDRRRAAAADQAVWYLAEGRRALGVVPTQDTLVLERFFDESGGMQLVLHAPFGSRINKAWGLALRKRFCRQFNFELQAAATEDALMLSLGPQHSFPLADVFRYLHPETTRDVLVQAFLDAPVFKTRWRWNTRSRWPCRARGAHGRSRRQIQRMLADDLMAAVFPDAAACLENIPAIGIFPITRSCRRRCAIASRRRWTSRVCAPARAASTGASSGSWPATRGAVALRARDPQRQSVRVSLRCPARGAAEPGRVNPAGDRSVVGGTRRPRRDAIARVREEERRIPVTPTSSTMRCLPPGSDARRDHGVRPELFSALTAAGERTPLGGPPGVRHLVAVERLPELLAIDPDLAPAVTSAAGTLLGKSWTRGEAIAELLRGRLMLTGPVTAAALADPLGISTAEAAAALLVLETEGVVLRGRCTPGETASMVRRTLLARIHRYTLNRLRAEIEPVSRRTPCVPLPLAARQTVVR